MNADHQALIDKAFIRLCPIGIELIQEPQAVELSRGGRNTVFHHCDVYEGRPSYASCLMVMDQTFEGTNTLRPDCQRAIETNTCPAINMRKAELRAGHTLFYVDYEELTKRRAAKLAREQEENGIKFRKRGSETKVGKFVPTQFDAKGQPIFDKTKLAELADQPKSTPLPPVHSTPTDDDYNTNIMEQVVKKVLNV